MFSASAGERCDVADEISWQVGQSDIALPYLLYAGLRERLVLGVYSCRSMSGANSVLSTAPDRPGVLSQLMIPKAGGLEERIGARPTGFGGLPDDEL